MNASRNDVDILHQTHYMYMYIKHTLSLSSSSATVLNACVNTATMCFLGGGGICKKISFQYDFFYCVYNSSSSIDVSSLSIDSDPQMRTSISLVVLSVSCTLNHGGFLPSLQH